MLVPVTTVSAPTGSNSYSNAYLSQRDLTVKTYYTVSSRNASIKTLTSIQTPDREGANVPRWEIEWYIGKVFGQHSNNAIKIANCESGFNPKAVNEKDALITGRASTGLFQINDGYYRGWDDYKVSTNRAYEKFQNGGWSHWLNCAHITGIYEGKSR